MHPIGPPDSHHLRAASGWLELGCPQDALVELSNLSKPNRQHPDVLELEWLVHAELKDWNSALETASQLIKTAPTRPAGWLHRSYAIRRLNQGGIQRAWELLLPALEKFPTEAVIPYNLSCYACQMGQLGEARKWLKQAVRIGKKVAIKKIALQDEDLCDLWDEIRNM